MLAGPFLVTGAGWTLAREMTVWHAPATTVLVAVIGHGVLYQANDDRDSDREAALPGLPLRFLSVLGVAFGSVALLALLLNAPASFLGDLGTVRTVEVTLTVISVGAIFSVVGAPVAESGFYTRSTQHA